MVSALLIRHFSDIGLKLYAMTKTLKAILLAAALLPLQLLAHVELNNPEGGETFFSGDTVLIKWTQLATHDTQNWELYFSSDGGANWEVISKSIGIEQREYAWEVPAVGTTKGKIRVFINNLNDTDYEDISPNFSIENTTGVDNDPSPEVLFGSFQIVPNPAQTTLSLHFDVKLSEIVSFNIFDLAGRQVGGIAGQLLQPGTYRIPWNSSGLKAGSYICVVRAGNIRKAYRFQVIP